jgi:hypothetical protein
MAHLLESLPESIRGLKLPQLSPPSPPAIDVNPLRNAVRRLGSMVVILLVALVAMTLLPAQMEQIERFMIGSWTISLVVGVLTIVLSSLLIPLLVIICIGLPVAIVLGLAVILAGLMGWVAAGKFAAGYLLPKLKIHDSTPLAQALIGTFAITLASMVPCVGTLFGVLVLCWALGSVVLTRFGLRSDWQWVTGPSGRAAAGQAPLTPIAVDTGDEPPTPTGPLADTPPDTKRLDPEDLEGEDLK